MAAPHERVRTTKACVACSIRKIKCDGGDPCAHCIRFFDGECFYTAAKKRGPPKGCPARGGHKKRQTNQQAEQEKKGNASSSGASASGEASRRGSTNGVSDRAYATAHQSRQHPSIDSHMSMDGSSGSPLLPTSALPIPAINDNIQDNLLNGFGIGNVNIDVTGRDDLFATPRSISSIPSTQSISLSFASQAGLTPEAIDEVLLVFETFIHPHWPVIYTPALRSLRSLETISPLVFDAVLAIATANADSRATPGPISPLPLSPDGRFASGTGRPMSEVCDLLTESVRQRVFASMAVRDYIPNIQAAQALIFVALVDLGCGRTSLAYQMGGFASRIAVDLGLHTHFPEYAPRPRDVRHIQERSRTVWACFILDKMTAAVSQRPPCLRLSDIDVPRPSVMERDELDLWLSGAASQRFVQPHARETMECIKSHALSSFNSWSDVMVILELILTQIYRPSWRRARMSGQHVEGYEDAVIHIDEQLRRWRQSLPPDLQWSDDDPQAHEHVGLHILTCRGWYHICMLLLHRPQVPYLDPPDSPVDTYLLRDQDTHTPSPRLPNGAEASRAAATAICTMMESYESTFRSRKFASSWVYLVFQAATVHAGLASHTPMAETSQLSPLRAESLRRLEQCIRWLDQIALQWSSAGRHVEILRKLSAMGARTRPPSPVPENIGNDVTAFAPSADLQTPSDGTVLPPMSDMDLNAWMLLWASMPTAGDDVTLWQQCFPTGPGLPQTSISPIGTHHHPS